MTPIGQLVFILKRASCSYSESKSENGDFHFSPIFNDLVVIENAGTSNYRISAHPFPDGH